MAASFRFPVAAYLLTIETIFLLSVALRPCKPQGIFFGEQMEIPLVAANNYVTRLYGGSGDMHMLRVWRFHSAPYTLQKLSHHGGDEDWLLLIPPDYGDSIWWAEEGSRFGCCSVQEVTLPSGWQVWIGAHS
jgi:hypothetical protein